MSTLIVEVSRIETVLPHGNADALELAQIKGWQCVIPKGRYAAGDLVTYIPIDAVIPPEHSDRWGFTKYLSNGRVRCAKLRGEPSFGVIVDREDDTWVEGRDVQDVYGITKYIPPVKFMAGDSAPAHPLFGEYTDVENLRNFPSVLVDDEEVVVTEKIHGCLAHNTNVTLANGSLARIMNIKPGDFVLGVDETGHIIPTRVLNVFNNGKAQEWMTLRGSRRSVGRGSSFFAVNCTPSHRFWDPVSKMYVEAQYLKIGSCISLLRSEYGLTPVQKQILLGKMLGDGFLHQTEYTAAVEWSQSVAQRDYIDWTLQGIGDLAGRGMSALTSGYGTAMLRTGTTFSFNIKRKFSSFIAANGKKIVPDWVADEISPLALAFWYMDDGSLSHHPNQEDRVLLATCGFDERDHAVLCTGLSKFAIKAVIYQSSKGHLRLRLNADDAERFFLLVAPYVPPSMQYKLPERYRGHPGWLPELKMTYKPSIVTQTITEVQRDNTKIVSSKWDIETETHNFFANGVLVHNSNCRLGLIEGELMAGSMSVRRKRPDTLADSIYWQPMEQPGVSALLEYLGQSARQVILYGEVFGSKVQNLNYGQVGTLGFRAFDVLVDGKYLDPDPFVAVCAQHGVPTVPVLYRGPYALETIKALSEGPTTLAADHIREGVVVKPVHERTDPKVGRVCLKYIGDPYLFAKNVTDSHDV